MSEPLLSIAEGYITFGGKPLFEDLTLHIHAGKKISLVGKNGSGKTTLMRIITGKRELDGGTRWQSPGITIGYVQQDIHTHPTQTVFDYIAANLENKEHPEEYRYKIDMVTAPLSLHPDDKLATLSGGQLRRASLAKALVEEPDLLLLDEPTNHLDIEAIQWLESYLKHYRGALLCVSHDKTFLATISNQVFWLDRGKIRVCPKGFSHFESWSLDLLEQEERTLRNRERAVALEEAWASRGVKARRKRNIQRLEAMKKARDSLKADKGSYLQTRNKVTLAPLQPIMSSRIVAEFYKVSKSFHDTHKTIPVLDQFSFRIMRGDRIGIMGKNGSGKTSFLQLLLHELQPDSGKIKLGKAIELTYFDQKRQDLNPKKSLRNILSPDGGDYIDVNGKTRHVCGYLKDFMFNPTMAHDLVGTLSGGQKNRLLLAKTLAKPGNVLILDEPTNDLDMDTLDMLEETLSQYSGTLIVVSHDRDFLDQTVSKLLVFEGNGEVTESIGGYEDYKKAKQVMKKHNNPDKTSNEEPYPQINTKKQTTTQKNPKKKKKRSYKDQYEFEQLPHKIAELEQEIQSLQQQLNEPTLYSKDPETFDFIVKRLPIAKEALDKAETRWLELEDEQN